MSSSVHGVYAPLPQSLSDSDSEKEVTMEPICTNHTNGLKSASNINFSDRRNGHIRLNNMKDDIHCTKTLNLKMSALRKTAFIFSIILCFLPIVIFLWILPCSDNLTCPKKIPNWETTRENIELQGVINLVHGAFENNWNIILMYEGSFNNPRSLKNGIMSFAGTNGAVVWDFQQKSLPSEINCTIIDVNRDGYNDCLVVDERGLKAIESTTGEVLWHAHTSEQTSIPELDMPIKIDDFNKDGVSDLLVVYRKETSLVISGKNGLAITNIRLPSGCSYVSNLRSYKNKTYIQYNCGRYQNSEIVYEISMQDLNAKFEDSQKQIPFETVKDKDNKVFYVTGDRKLLVENLNHCPHCEGVISLYNTNNTKLYTQSFKNAVIMTPVPFSVISSKENIENLKGHLHGFVLKIWLWQDNSKKLSPSTRVYKRSIPVHNETFHLNQVSERVVLITLRENDTQVENVSDSDIYLICNGPEHDNCQPDHKNQQYSLMIADLDQDSSLELVSYSSTYERREEEGYEAWHLISKLKVFRLESELPKLYDKN